MRLAILLAALGCIVSSGCREPQGGSDEPNGPGFDEAIFGQFSPAPENIPDVRSPQWAHVMDSYNEVAQGLRDAKDAGAGVPTVLIDDGVCAESNNPCSFTLIYASSQRVEGEVPRDWVIRWILRSDVARTEGLSRARRDAVGEPLSYEHFKRSSDRWVAVAEDSEEYEVLQQLSSAVVYLIRYIEAAQ